MQVNRPVGEVGSDKNASRLLRARIAEGHEHSIISWADSSTRVDEGATIIFIAWQEITELLKTRIFAFKAIIDPGEAVS